MTILFIFLGGLTVGALAKRVMPEKDTGGIAVTSLLGGAAAVVAGFLGQALNWFSPAEPAGFVVCMIVSIVALSLYKVAALRLNS